MVLWRGIRVLLDRGLAHDCWRDALGVPDAPQSPAPDRTTALATTVHDRQAALLPGIVRLADRLAAGFDGVVASVTAETDVTVVAALTEIGSVVTRHDAGNKNIARARRDAVGLALTLDPDQVLYSDLGHALRWLENDPAELERALHAGPDTELLVIGRSERAFARSPARLRETERVVNHIYELAMGRTWDLMFAIRRLSPRAAGLVVAECGELEFYTNDVVWPLLAEARGFSVGYFAADGLDYRTTADFDSDADERDGEPLLWLERLEIAADQGRAMRRYLGQGGGTA
jgi:hypothetical protein